MAHVFAFLRAYNRRSKLNPSLRLAAGVSGSRQASPTKQTVTSRPRTPVGPLVARIPAWAVLA